MKHPISQLYSARGRKEQFAWVRTGQNVIETGNLLPLGTGFKLVVNLFRATDSDLMKLFNPDEHSTHSSRRTYRMSNKKVRA